MLKRSGFDVTHTDNICNAEILAEGRHFDAAVYDSALPPHEQLSLARVMRIRWPWMRLVTAGAPPEQGLFDASESSEAKLPETLRAILV